MDTRELPIIDRARATAGAIALRSALTLVLSIVTSLSAPSDLVAGEAAPDQGPKGNYGFLSCSVMGPQEEAAARGRVRVMADEFGIREFMFYDWFSDYSTPVKGDAWTDPYFRTKPIQRQTLEWYIDEIHQQGGRAWAYVQAVGSEETDLAENQSEIYPLKTSDGQWYWHPGGREGEGRFPTYFLNGAWAAHMVKVWAPSVRELGFDGIHWDTLGPIAGDRGAEIKGFHAFLHQAHPLLQPYGLKQTMNFVDLHGLEPDVVKSVVEFPYAETWSRETADRYLAMMGQPEWASIGGVWAMYPEVDVPVGWTPSRVILHRHQEAGRHHLRYVIVGDGARRMVNEYWPRTEVLTDQERSVLGRGSRVAGDPMSRDRCR